MHSYTKSFIWSAIIVLALTASAKLFSVYSYDKHYRHNDLLELKDPIFQIENRKVLACVGIVEVLIAFILSISRINVFVKLALIGWLGINFLAYRVGLKLVNFDGWCSCLGNFSNNPYIGPLMSAAVLSSISIYFFLGSLAFVKIESGRPKTP